MSDEIIKILDDLGQKFGIAIDWSSQNVMPYLQDLMGRYIKYETMTSIMWLLMGVLLVLLGIAVAYKGFKSGDPDSGAIAVIFVPIAIVGVIIIICQCNDIITANTIPEKMIFEYLNSLLSN